jgi:hypothetical protein
LFSNFWFSFDAVGTMKNSINEWEPLGFTKESEAEIQLTAHLKSLHPNLEIRNQFPHDRVIADIVVEKRLAIELKLNLTDNNEFNRLLGQIDHYYQWGVNLIIVVVGDCREDYLLMINRKLSKLWDEPDFYSLIHLPFK